MTKNELRIAVIHAIVNAGCTEAAIRVVLEAACDAVDNMPDFAGRTGDESMAGVLRSDVINHIMALMPEGTR